MRASVRRTLFTSASASIAMRIKSAAATAAKAAADAVVRQAYANLRPANSLQAGARAHRQALRWMDRVTSDLYLPHFRPGLKQVYFPQFYVQLLRSHLPANYARFRVSRQIGKLDLRDFLWNCYGVRAFNIRSSLRYQPIEDHDGRLHKRRIFRRQPIKFMTIEMDQPFHWPAPPTDKSAWDKDIFDHEQTQVDKDLDERKHRVPWAGSDKLKFVTEHRSKIAKQARALLRGQVKWEPTWQVLKREVPDLKAPISSRES